MISRSTPNCDMTIFAHIASQQLAALIIAFPGWEPQQHIDESLAYAAMLVEALNNNYPSERINKRI